jgi:hypothetical protein
MRVACAPVGCRRPHAGPVGPVRQGVRVTAGCARLVAAGQVVRPASGRCRQSPAGDQHGGALAGRVSGARRAGPRVYGGGKPARAAQGGAAVGGVGQQVLQQGRRPVPPIEPPARQPGSSHVQRGAGRCPAIRAASRGRGRRWWPFRGRAALRRAALRPPWSAMVRWTGLGRFSSAIAWARKVTLQNPCSRLRWKKLDPGRKVSAPPSPARNARCGWAMPWWPPGRGSARHTRRARVRATGHSRRHAGKAVASVHGHHPVPGGAQPRGAGGAKPFVIRNTSQLRGRGSASAVVAHPPRRRRRRGASAGASPMRRYRHPAGRGAGACAGACPVR